MLHLKDESFTIYNSTNSGLPANTIYSLAIESDSIKWIGVNNGKLVRYDNQIWNVYDSSNSGYKMDNVFSMEIYEHTKWFSSNFHGLGRFNDTTWTYYTPENSGILDYTIFSIYIENSSNIWLGTRFKGAHHFNDLSNQWTYIILVIPP